MSFKALTTKIKLAYPPISAYEFEILKDEDVVQELFKNAMVYVLVQRPVLSFEKIEPMAFENCSGISFEIHRQGSDSILKCNLPFKQTALDIDEDDKIFMEVGSHTLDKMEFSNIINEVHGIKFYDHKEDFIHWISPDKFIYEILNNQLVGKLEGNLEEFISFKVHYVGKSTDQDIWDRLTGHHSLQKILTMQKPIIKGHLPAHEIALLLLKIEDLQSFSIIEDVADFFSDSLPSNKTVSLDVEKMFVKLMNPEYNHPTKRFPGYPKSTDGLYQYNFNKFTYQLLDAVTLEYDDNTINGDLDANKADLILISENQTVEIIKL
ncbi:hypothetical protein [uncultured Flavobacterium sp.]|uniref:hypothetical protein n=1 Tax=uncultured Flavobacterium sp. TaxID=165435 RepID=UPI002592EF82|nr:hypothetical protein [uncultured Flavobacterium sp.]